MIAYSVTVSIDRDIEKDWSAWMRDVHIPDVMATGYFEKYEMHRTLEDEAGDRATYIIRYYCSSLQRYRDYQLKTAPRLQQDHAERYKGRFEASRIVSEVVAGGPTAG